MRNARTIALSLFVGLSAVLGTARAAHQIAVSPEQIQHLGITLAKVAPAHTVMTDRVPAQVVIPPEQERVISSPQAGLVTSLRAAVGDEIKAGEVVARIESPDLVKLQREFLQASADLRLADADLKRDEQLFKEGIIAERRYLATRNRFEQASARVDERRQALRLAGMDTRAVTKLERDRKLSSVLNVRSPMAGAVLDQMAVVGQRVDRSAPLYRVGKLEPLWLAIRVPLDRIGKLSPGVEVSLPCSGATAVVTVVGRNVDPNNQTVLVRAEVHNAAGCIRPGQFIQVRMALLGGDSQWRVPTAALVRSGNSTLVFVKTVEGFRPQSVEVLGREAGFSVVRGELRGDEEVAASGLAAIKSIWLGQEPGQDGAQSGGGQGGTPEAGANGTGGK
ncbi:MAG: efflux RND transporter periplasmic adaptor subunit [Gammaproteobacteria bacterium]